MTDGRSRRPGAAIPCDQRNGPPDIRTRDQLRADRRAGCSTTAGLANESPSGGPFDPPASGFHRPADLRQELAKVKRWVGSSALKVLPEAELVAQRSSLAQR